MHRPQKKRFCEFSNAQVIYGEGYCDLPKKIVPQGQLKRSFCLAAAQYLAIEKPNFWYCGRDGGSFVSLIIQIDEILDETFDETSDFQK